MSSRIYDLYSKPTYNLRRQIAKPIRNNNNTNTHTATPCQGTYAIYYYIQQEYRIFLYTQPKYCGIHS